MKTKVLLILSVLVLLGCYPRISYLGDEYGTTTNVDIYYDEGDIEKDYRVIGLARNGGDELERDDLEGIRKAMIDKAKSVGADAILFISIENNREHFKAENRNVVEAKFLRYK